MVESLGGRLWQDMRAHMVAQVAQDLDYILMLHKRAKVQLNIQLP